MPGLSNTEKLMSFNDFVTFLTCGMEDCRACNDYINDVQKKKFMLLKDSTHVLPFTVVFLGRKSNSALPFSPDDHPHTMTGSELDRPGG